MTTKRLLTALAALLGIIGGTMMLPSTASAHDPIVTGSTECRPSESSPWVVTWVVQSDSTRPDLTWEIEFPANSYPAGQRAYNETFSRQATYPASLAVAVETVRAVYYIGGAFDKKSTRSGEVQRPPVCEGGTTTTPTTTTTTTAPPVCETNPQLPPDDPACNPPTIPPTNPPVTPTTTTTTTTTTTPPVCETNPQLPPDDPACNPTTTVAPPEVCESNPQLPADDPNCESDSSSATTTTLNDSSSGTTTVAPRLPDTGTNADTTFWTGLMLAAAGGSILLATRRRPTEL